MSLNQILAISEAVGINDQRFVGQVVSRNQRMFTSEIITVVPFVFTFKPMSYLRYSKSRELLNSLRIPDKSLEQYLNFGTTGWKNYIEYQGQLTPTQISSCQWQTTSVAKTLVLGNLPSISNGAIIVKVGDFCQVGRYSYIATETVYRGYGTTVEIPVHRGLIDPVTAPINAVIGEFGTTVSMGGDNYTGITFPVILRSYPSYVLTPFANDSYIQWGGEFLGFESVL